MKSRAFVLGSLVVLLGAGLLFLRGCGGESDGPGSKSEGFDITAYEDGRATGNWNADSYAYSEDEIGFVLSKKDDAGNQTGQAKGTWVVKHRNWNSAAGAAKYKATLYSGGKAVASWNVLDFTAGERSVLLYPSDGSAVLRVCGTLVLQSLDSQPAGAANHRLTVSSGGQVVFAKELNWYTRIGHYITGGASDGSGKVFVWGDALVEDLGK